MLCSPRERALLLIAVAATLACACNTAHYGDAGHAAWQRGDAKLALANLRAARKTERHLLSAAQRRRLDAELAEVSHHLARPALRAAAVAIEAGDGGRALDILLPLYGGRGLYSSLTNPALRSAREKMLPLVGQAIAAASGVDLRALSSGEGAVAAVSERVSSVRERIERNVDRGARRPLLDLLGDVARPVLAKGWQLVDAHLLAARTEAAVALAFRLAAVFPDDRELQSNRQRTLRRASSHHQARARANAAYPGIQWAHLALSGRYGGPSHEAAALQSRLRAATFRVESYAGCAELAGLVRSSLSHGVGGVPITVDVQLGRCRTVDRTWQTRKRVSWTEQRTRQVRVQERYTAYETERKCKYVQVYANTTCTTSYVGNGYSRRTCRPNYSSMQRCHNESRPVTRTRWVMRTQRYTVRLSLIRVTSWYETALQVSGRAVVRWPGGGVTLPYSFAAGLKDHGFRDQAGSRQARRLPMGTMRTAAAQRLARAVHATHGAALRPKAAQLRRRALLAAEAGDDLHAVDFALQAWLLGGALQRADGQRFAATLQIPLALAAQPSSWSRSSQQRLTSRATGRTTGRPKPMSLHMDQAFRMGDGPPASELVSPRLPEPDRAIRHLYRELAPTAWAAGRRAERVGSVRVDAGPSPLAADRLHVSLRSGLRLTDQLRLSGGVDLAPLGLGTRGWEVGLDFGALARRRGAFSSGVGVRYGSHATVDAPGMTGSTLRSSNLDVSYFFRAGGVVGFWARFALNLASWLGDDALQHYHPQSAGLDLHVGPLELRAGGTWHAGGGGLRWRAGVGVHF